MMKLLISSDTVSNATPSTMFLPKEPTVMDARLIREGVGTVFGQDGETHVKMHVFDVGDVVIYLTDEQLRVSMGDE